LQLQAKYIASMAKNHAAQYEVVAVDEQRSMALKFKARRWQGKDAVLSLGRYLDQQHRRRAGPEFMADRAMFLML